MADTKISALTAATTPLAGTEVLPIVQSSTTKQVSVANLTAGRTVSAASLSLTTTPLAVTSGGTGLATVAQGDLLYGSASNTLSVLAKNTTATRYLANTGTSNNPAWAQVDLTNGVTGTLPVGNGGTGNTTGAATAIKSNATTGLMEIVGPAASTTRVMTIPNANFTAARTDAAQTFTGNQTFSNNVIAANFQTISNSATIAGSATATVLTLSSSAVGTYYVTADFGSQGNEIYSGMAIIVANAGSFRIVTNGGGTRSAISLSGANVQITNALGITLTAYAAAMFVGY